MRRLFAQQRSNDVALLHKARGQSANRSRPAPLSLGTVATVAIMYKRQWLRPLKLREYYVDPFVPDVRNAEYQLYWAVVEGNIRAKHKGKILTREEADALREKRWSNAEGDLYQLPADIELSVEDAEHIWGGAQLPLPESLTRALNVGNVTALGEENQPERQRRQPRGNPARDSAQRAIDALYPSGVPDQATISNARLCRAAGEWLKRNGYTNVSDDTILRAAGRRK
jgi:hypothetical protein